MDTETRLRYLEEENITLQRFILSIQEPTSAETHAMTRHIANVNAELKAELIRYKMALDLACCDAVQPPTYYLAQILKGDF